MSKIDSYKKSMLNPLIKDSAKVTSIDELKTIIEERTVWTVSNSEISNNWILSRYSSISSGTIFSFEIEHNNDVEKAIDSINDFAYDFREDIFIKEAKDAFFFDTKIPSAKEVADEAKAIQGDLYAVAEVTYQSYYRNNDNKEIEQMRNEPDICDD